MKLLKDKKILVISSEVVPYLPQTEKAVNSFLVSKKINDFGGMTRIFMPKYGIINERRHQLHEVIRLSGMNMIINDLYMPLIIKVASIPKERMQVYFIDNEDYFKRNDLLKDKDDILLKDNDERMIFFTKGVIETVKMIKKEFPSKDVIAGNVATPEGAEALIEAGADGIKIGMGPGSICTTRIIAGIGVPQISAILTIYEKVKGKVPLIADGGMRYSGDIAKAIAAGADSVMLGSIFAGTEEAPGEFELYQGRSFKTYRGMGSLGAMSKRDDSNRYFQEDIDAEKLVPEGVEGRVPYKGWAINVINQLIGGLRQSMGYVGCKNIQEMKENSRFVEITNAGMTESHVHDVQITKEAPNYQRS